MKVLYNSINIRYKFSFILIALTLGALMLSSCKKEDVGPSGQDPAIAASGHLLQLPDSTCGTPEVRDLLDQSGNVLGQAELMNDEKNHYVWLRPDNSWFVSKYKVFIGKEQAIPENDAQTQLLLEKFPYQKNFNQEQSEALLSIIRPGSACYETIIWVELVQKNFLGNITATQTVWLDAVPLHQGYSFKYCAAPCS